MTKQGDRKREREREGERETEKCRSKGEFPRTRHRNEFKLHKRGKCLSECEELDTTAIHWSFLCQELQHVGNETVSDGNFAVLAKPARMNPHAHMPTWGLTVQGQRRMGRQIGSSRRVRGQK